MKEKVTIMAAKPQFIRLSDGSLMNINNIVAISEADGKVFVSAYQRVPITKEDMADVLENIEIIDDDEQPRHCGLDSVSNEEAHASTAATKLCDLLVRGRLGEKCAKCGGYLSCGLGVKEGGEILCFNCASQITIKELQQALDEYRATYTHHCGQDAGECKVSCGNLETTVSCKNLLGMQVVSVGGSATRCVGCPQETAGCVKVELVGGDCLCLAKRPEQDKPNAISFDKVVINPQEQ